MRGGIIMKKRTAVITLSLLLILVMILSAPVFALKTANATIAGVSCNATLSRGTTSATATTSCGGNPSTCTVTLSLTYYYSSDDNHNGKIEDNEGHRITQTASNGNLNSAYVNIVGQGVNVSTISSSSSHSVYYSNQSWSAALSE